MKLCRSIPAVAACLFSVSLAGQADDLAALNGEWIFVEDLTAGRTLEQLTPPMGGRFGFRVEGSAVVLVSGHGGRGGRFGLRWMGRLRRFRGPARARWRGIGGLGRTGLFLMRSTLFGPRVRLRSG